MTETVMMPKSLTAENGAKALLIGEFHEELERQCEHCWGQGNFVDEISEEVVEDCEECNGTGTYIEKVTVSWTTIKEIYAKAVEHLAT